MKRRALAKAFLVGLVCGPAFAADPLPALQETPMFAEQVKSGALPPVAERVPRPPWVVREFAGGDGPGRQGGLSLPKIRSDSIHDGVRRGWALQ
jgi:peptide/nickel transport system substrate-binding protein